MLFLFLHAFRKPFAIVRIENIKFYYYDIIRNTYTGDELNLISFVTLQLKIKLHQTETRADIYN